jgi:hypothetical protein
MKGGVPVQARETLAPDTGQVSQVTLRRFRKSGEASVLLDPEATPPTDETQSSAPMPNSRLLSTDGHVCPHPTYVRASQATQTNLCPLRGGVIRWDELREECLDALSSSSRIRRTSSSGRPAGSSSGQSS